VDAMLPLTLADEPCTDTLPFAPTSPPLLTALLGGTVGGFSVAELKLAVAIFPCITRGLAHPVPVAKRPPGWPALGVCASSSCISRRVPVLLTARDVTK